jgi:hypothetical protein
MHGKIPTGSKTTKEPTAEPESRKLTSWIESFVEETARLEAPAIYRRWSAISALGATLEQKVWLHTTSNIYPNFYIMIVGHPAVGKTRSIRASRELVRSLPDPHFAPVSMTFPSLVDNLMVAKRMIIRIPHEPLEYNSLYISADELGAFIHKFDPEMTDGLSALYDPDPYTQTRRTRDVKTKIDSPQINMICGSTPDNLMALLPDKAWGQGFMSRVIMVFSDERTVGDDFETKAPMRMDDLKSDLATINNLTGQFEVTQEYKNAVMNWRSLGEVPVPAHPRLIHYNGRRKVNLYKLSMISAIDRSNTLLLTKEDFNRAMRWLLEAETTMPEIFKAGVGNADAQALEEIKHYILINDKGKGVPEYKIVGHARKLIPIHSIMRVVDILVGSGTIREVASTIKGQRMFRIVTDESQLE